MVGSQSDGQPLVVPICYVFDDECIYSPLDEKPKVVATLHLQRVRNIAANPRAALVIDDYAEDWSQLSYVLITGVAEVIEPDYELSSSSPASCLLPPIHSLTLSISAPTARNFSSNFS